MNQIKNLITYIEDNLYKIEQELNQEPNKQEILWARYLSMINEIKEKLIELDTK